MKKYFLGVLTGFIICTMFVSTFAIANSPIKLIVNGREVTSDVPPQIIDGRTMIPARPLAEALGAKVEWDEANYAVVVTGGIQAGATPTDLEATNMTVSEIDSIQKEEEEKSEEFISSEWVAEDELGKYGFTVKKDEGEGAYYIEKNRCTLVTPRDFAYNKDGKVYNRSIRGEDFRIRLVNGKLYVNKEDLETCSFFDGVPVLKTIASPENKLKKIEGDISMEEWVDVKEIADKYTIDIMLNDEKRSFFFSNKHGFTINMHYDVFPKDGTPYILDTSKYGELRMKMVDDIIYFNITDFLNAKVF